MYAYLIILKGIFVLWLSTLDTGGGGVFGFSGGSHSIIQISGTMTALQQGGSKCRWRDAIGDPIVRNTLKVSVACETPNSLFYPSSRDKDAHVQVHGIQKDGGCAARGCDAYHSNDIDRKRDEALQRKFRKLERKLQSWVAVLELHPMLHASEA